jgi:hypothetical protein
MNHSSYQEAHMSPNFHDELNLQNSSRTVAAGGPCNWEPADQSAEIREVTITQQGGVVGSSGTASTTVRRDRDRDWWLDANSSRQFTRGSAQASARAIVRRTDNTTYERPWSEGIQLH